METETEQVKWYYRPIPAVLMLFLVLGPFGLPFVYRSPKFSKLTKVILTIVMVPYTWYMVVMTVKSVRFAVERAAELQDIGK